MFDSYNILIAVLIVPIVFPIVVLLCRAADCLLFHLVEWLFCDPAERRCIDLGSAWNRRMADLGAEKATEAYLSDLDCRRCKACGHPLPGAGPTAQVSAGVGIWRRDQDGTLSGPYCCPYCAEQRTQKPE